MYTLFANEQLFLLFSFECMIPIITPIKSSEMTQHFSTVRYRVRSPIGTNAYCLMVIYRGVEVVRGKRVRQKKFHFYTSLAFIAPTTFNNTITGKYMCIITYTTDTFHLLRKIQTTRQWTYDPWLLPSPKTMWTSFIVKNS